MTGSRTLRVAVVGHTNTGKTSLLRTLMRDADFGEVSDRPAVTRHVESAQIVVSDGWTVEVFDTPGLEDSISLLDHLDTIGRDGRRTGIEQVRDFLSSDSAAGPFAQEAKSLRQVLDSDAALYVIDARDRVLAKFRDELEILSRCARPVVPVLNFVASGEANTTPWRSALAELNLHAVAEFDTVVFDQAGEIRLFEKLRTLLDEFQPVLDALIEKRRRERRELIAGTARLIAELLVDVAAYSQTIARIEQTEAERQVEQFKQQVREREQYCVDDLLHLYRFREEDLASAPLPIEGGQWGVDLFSPAALKQFGIRTGGAVAAGAATGLVLDVMFGGMSLGAWTTLGASLGAAVELGRTHGRRLFDRARGYSELRCDQSTLIVLLVRQTRLAQALLRRGHAAVSPIALADDSDTGRSAPPHWTRDVVRELDEAKIHPGWSRLGEPRRVDLDNAHRQQVVRRICQCIETQLGTAA